VIDNSLIANIRGFFNFNIFLILQRNIQVEVLNLFICTEYNLQVQNIIKGRDTGGICFQFPKTRTELLNSY